MHLSIKEVFGEMSPQQYEEKYFWKQTQVY